MADKKQELKSKEVQTTMETEPTRDRRVYIPRVDIIETADAIRLLADMPGVDDKNIDITLEKGILTIYGTVEPERDTARRLTYSEYDTGDFQRSFAISDEIDQGKIKAMVKDGVLTLILPKAEPAKPRKIAVTTS